MVPYNGTDRYRSCCNVSPQAEVDALFERRREMELAYMESKQKRQEQYQAEIEALLTRDGEEHTKLKIKLETDIQVGEGRLADGGAHGALMRCLVFVRFFE